MNPRPSRPCVDLKSPMVRIWGRLRSGVNVFLGVPYAAAPVGEARWTAPRPPVFAGADFAADRFGPDGVQEDRNPGYLGSRAARRDEDCLYLNIWSPADAHDLPVMVWIHGGGFVGGSGSNHTYDGAALARHGVVVVTLNYRIGVFGYLAHPELSAESPEGISGNYGLLDQIAGLAWVREHIAAFGGDASNITAFGQSAGASSISHLLTSPLARGLIDKAILQSPGPMRGLMALDEAEARGAALDPLAVLRLMPAQDLLALNRQLVPGFRKVIGPRGLGPVLDGRILVQQDWEAHATGAVAPIPVVLGCNGAEGESAARARPFASTRAYLDYVRASFGDETEAALEHYAAATASGLHRAVSDLFGDTQFVFGTRTLARLLSRREPRTFLYWFDPGRGGQRASPGHGDELPYVFGALNAPFDGEVGHNLKADFRLSELLMTAWTRFAASGWPDLPGVDWSPVTPERDQCMMLDHACGMGVFPRARSLDFLMRFRGLEAGL